MRFKDSNSRTTRRQSETLKILMMRKYLRENVRKIQEWMTGRTITPKGLATLREYEPTDSLKAIKF